MLSSWARAVAGTKAGEEGAVEGAGGREGEGGEETSEGRGGSEGHDSEMIPPTVAKGGHDKLLRLRLAEEEEEERESAGLKSDERSVPLTIRSSSVFSSPAGGFVSSRISGDSDIVPSDEALVVRGMLRTFVVGSCDFSPCAFSWDFACGFSPCKSCGFCAFSSSAFRSCGSCRGCIVCEDSEACAVCWDCGVGGLSGFAICGVCEISVSEVVNFVAVSDGTFLREIGDVEGDEVDDDDEGDVSSVEVVEDVEGVEEFGEVERRTGFVGGTTEIVGISSFVSLSSFLTLLVDVVHGAVAFASSCIRGTLWGVLGRSAAGRGEGGVGVSTGDPRGVVAGEGAPSRTDSSGDASAASRGEVAGDISLRGEREGEDQPVASSSHGSSASPDLRWNHLLCFA